jgi:hypothetical protein
MGFVILAVIVCGAVGLVIRRNRDRATNAPLRAEIEARICFETALDRVEVLGTGGFRGTRRYWHTKRGPTRLVVGTDFFMISAPQALSEYVFTGRESSIAIAQMPFGPAGRDWIVIKGQAGGRQVQLALTHRGNLMDIWRALAGTGAAL